MRNQLVELTAEPFLISLHDRVERCLNFSKLCLPLCPIFWHEHHEQREHRFIIKHLRGEQSKTESEQHEHV